MSQGHLASHYYLGRVALRGGRLETARDHLEAGITIAREVDHPEVLFLSLMSLGELVRRHGDDSAREYYKEGVELVADLDLTNEAAKSYGGLCALARRDGAYDQASDHFEEDSHCSNPMGIRSGGNTCVSRARS